MTLKARKKSGEEVIARYQAARKDDRYTAAVDAISEILLAVAQTDKEATQILHAAEVDFRNASESESFASEG